MERRSDRIMAEWAEGNRRMGFERRDWNSGHWLTTLCVVLLFSGLAASVLIGSSRVATICWIGAAVSAVGLLIRFYHSRFFIHRNPGA